MPEVPFTPAPAAPQFQQRNPLEMASQMQGLAAQAQQMQQRQQMFDAQNALGELMQQHVNPETNDIDMHELLAKGASNPALRPIYSSLLKDALAADLTKAQTLNSRFEAEQKRHSIIANISAGILEDAARTGKQEGLLPDFVARGVAAGVFDGRQGAQQLIALMDAKKNGQTEISMLRRGLSHSQLAQETLKNAGLDLKTLTAPVETFDQDPKSMTYGQKVAKPAYMVPGTLAPGVQMQAPNAAASGLAPSGEQAARQEGVPSPPPAASAGRLLERPIPYQLEEEARKPESAWGKLAQEVREEATNSTANMQSINETRGLVADLEKLGKSGTGPTAKIRAQAARLLNEARDLFDAEGENSPLRNYLANYMGKASKVITQSENPKEWAGAAEALEKLGAITAIGGLRRAVGSANKVTQQEVLKFIDIFPGLMSSPGGINRMLNYMEKVNESLIEREKFFNFYSQHKKNKMDRTRAFNPTVFDEEWNKIMRQHENERNSALKAVEE